MKKKPKVVFMVVVFIIILSSYFTFAQEDNKDGKVIILLINRLNLEDIDKMIYLKGIINHGAIGLMNTRANEYNNDYGSTATIGAGTRTDAKHDTSRFVNSNEENLQIFIRRTGFLYSGEKITNLDIARLIELNKENNYNPFLGALGKSIHNLDKKTGVIGNSDIGDYNVRLGPLVAMDDRGLVDNGNIEGKSTIAMDSYPFGLKTNYDFMLEVLEDTYKSTDLIILELGDLYRLEKYKDNLSEEMFIVHRDTVLKEIDINIKRMYEFIEMNKSKLIIMSPYPSVVSYAKGERLTPVITVGKDVDTGVLTSYTTRREGIISNLDIAPYVVDYFNGSTNKFIGHPMKILSMESSLDYIKNLNLNTAFVYNNRINVLYSFALYEIIISIIAFIGIQIFEKYNLKSKAIKAIQFLLLSNMAIPFVLLVLPLFGTNSLVKSFSLIIVLTTIITFISVSIGKKSLDSIIFLSGITSLGIILDIFNNSILMKNSFLGYDPIIGARFYGIGNEYMGILIGSIIVFLTSIMDRYHINRLYIIPIMGVAIIAIGFPSLGANVGGTITSAFAFMFVSLRLLKENLKWKHYAYIFSGVILLLITLGLIDLFIIESKSHFANALNQIENSGIPTIFSIIKRKISMNLKLLGITIWSKVLLSSLLLLSILFYRPFGITKRVLAKYPNSYVGFLGVLIACLVGFGVNDSGIVASATAMIFLIMSIMYLIFNELKEI